MNEITFNVLKIVVTLCSVWITYYLVPYIKNKIAESKNKQLIDTIARAVRAAEQTIKESGQGKVKKAEVVAFVSHWLTEKGIHITEDQLDKLIEAAVFTMNNGGAAC